jgi:hypothetical protein
MSGITPSQAPHDQFQDHVIFGLVIEPALPVTLPGQHHRQVVADDCRHLDPGCQTGQFGAQPLEGRPEHMNAPRAGCEEAGIPQSSGHEKIPVTVSQELTRPPGRIPNGR